MKTPPGVAIEFTRKSFELFEESFIRAGKDNWVKLARAVGGDKIPNGRQYVMIANLIRDGYIENETRGGVRFIRLTPPGWKLFENLPQPAVLQARFAGERERRNTAKRPHNQPCTTCHGKVESDRRADCTTCWGCEQPSLRQKAGKDHMPRTQAYYERIGHARAKAERARVAAIRKELQPTQPPPTRDQMSLAQPAKGNGMHVGPAEKFPAPLPMGPPTVGGPASVTWDAVNRLLAEQGARITRLEAQVKYMADQAERSSRAEKMEPLQRTGRIGEVPLYLPKAEPTGTTDLMRMAAAIADLRAAGFEVKTRG